MHYMLLGGTPRACAVRAGLKRPTLSANNLLSRTDIQEAIANGIAARILADGAPAAARFLIGLVRNKKASNRERLDASSKLLAMAGFVAPKAPERADLGAKPLHKMTREELNDLAQNAQRILSDRAAPVIDTFQEARDDELNALNMLK